MDRVEYYNTLKGNRGLICSMDSSIVPRVDSHVNIRKETWRVLSVTYTLDYVDDIPREQRAVAVVHLVKL
jgi:adenosyl cobinamide kinase/adenosyl cobinamide phosphate guanylyltransferase